MNKKRAVWKVLSQTRFAVYLLLILSMLAMPDAPAFAQAPANGNTPPATPAPTPSQTRLSAHKCGAPGSVKNSPFYGIQLKTQKEVKGTEKTTTLSEVLKKRRRTKCLERTPYAASRR